MSVTIKYVAHTDEKVRNHLLQGRSSENQALHICSIDPGVRCFATVYSEDVIYKLGNNFIKKKLVKLMQRIDYLSKVRSKLYNEAIDKYGYKNIPVKAKNINRAYQKKLQQTRKRYQNLIRDLHYKVAHFLVTKFDIIILPTFQVKQMLGKKLTKEEYRALSRVKKQRYSRRKQNRNMLSLSHYKFKLIMKWMCQKYGKVLVHCSESYTSKTKSWSGEIDYNLEGSSTIRDNNIIVNRDINGARNIYIKVIQEMREFLIKNSALHDALASAAVDKSTEAVKKVSLIKETNINKC